VARVAIPGSGHNRPDALFLPFGWNIRPHPEIPLCLIPLFSVAYLLDFPYQVLKIPFHTDHRTYHFVKPKKRQNQDGNRQQKIAN
jgi:hypothetical protein